MNDEWTHAGHTVQTAYKPDAKRARNVTVPGPSDRRIGDRVYRVANCSAAAAKRSFSGLAARCIEEAKLSEKRVSSVT